MARDYIRVKDWMYVNREKRTKAEFIEGVASFMNFVREHDKIQHGMILCPCSHCGNTLYRKEEDVELHIVKYGFIRGYTTWVYHGEILTPINAEEEEEEPKFAAMTKVLDEVHGGHHGGYERDLGHGVSRHYLKTSSTPIFATLPDVLREMAELKSKMERLTQLIDSQTTRPPPIVPATTPPTLAHHSLDAQSSTSAAQCFPRDISTQSPLASRLEGVLGGILGSLTQEGYSEEDIRKAFADYIQLNQP
ncbi:uncharacterized protein LOC109843216 [Asparagus officinalis]|uniref:uncharacterized protein LOC109843216 n=1 Tax=Asparagus officinalis TaxID=4686 RepID=UPI00098E4757|nr:uncharacterized protein LOC109843216 [Asparagus officinalis]